MPKAEGGGSASQAQLCCRVWLDKGASPLCHSVTSPPAERGEKQESGRDVCFSSRLGSAQIGHYRLRFRHCYFAELRTDSDAEFSEIPATSTGIS